jgi:zinc transport system ATP-binding protein
LNPEAVAEIRRCEVVLGPTRVIDGIDLEICAGEFIALLGANGSGKTTLVRAMLGLLPLEAGEIKLFGKPLDGFSEWGRIGYVPQRFGAVSGVPATVEEVVLTGRIPVARKRRGFSADDREAAGRALESVDLADLRRRRTSALSGGQQQRVLIARALVNAPDFLVLDEPVSNVDLENQQSFADTLGLLSDSHTTVLLLAHALGVMQPLIDRTVVLDHGRVIYDGPPKAEHMDDHVHHHPGEPGEGQTHRRRTADHLAGH